MQLLILCGGLGTRLRPITEKVPKSMIEFNGKPFLEYLINYYKSQGIKEFILSVGYLKEKIKKYFKNGEDWNVKIYYVEENKALGTGGAIKQAEKFLKDTFFVANGDTFVELNLENLRELHEEVKSLCTIAVKKAKRSQNSGYIQFDKENRVIDFKSKVDLGRELFTSTGIYLMDKRFLERFPKSDTFSLEDDVFAVNLNGVFAYTVNQGYFIDIGTFETYNALEKDFQKISNAINNPLKSSSKN